MIGVTTCSVMFWIRGLFSFIDTAREDWMSKKGKQDVTREANGGVLPEGVAALPPLKVYTVFFGIICATSGSREFIRSCPSISESNLRKS